MLSLFRIIKFALQDMVRNFSLSFMTVLILVLMLLSVNTLTVVNVITKEAVQTVKDQIDVSVYFSNDANDEQIQEVKSYIDSFPEVTDITYLDRDQVLAQFKEQHKDNTEIVASLDELGENPLGPTMIIKTREPQDYQKVITALTIPEYESIIEAKTFGDTEKAISRIQVVTTQVERFTLTISVLFAVIAFFIIFNTIRVAIYTQRIEISIKKLVGATSWFVRGPYIAESFIFSIISVFVSYIIIKIVLHFVDPYMAIIFQREAILVNYYQANLLYLLTIQFLVVLFLTVMSSLLAMRKHLKV